MTHSMSLKQGQQVKFCLCANYVTFVPSNLKKNQTKGLLNACHSWSIKIKFFKSVIVLCLSSVYKCVWGARTKPLWQLVCSAHKWLSVWPACFSVLVSLPPPPPPLARLISTFGPAAILCALWLPGSTCFYITPCVWCIISLGQPWGQQHHAT